MKRKQKLVFLAMFVGLMAPALLAISSPQSVYAQLPSTEGGGDPTRSDKTPAAAESPSKDPAAGDDCGGVKTAIIKCDAKNSGDITDNGVWALLLITLNILTAGVGIIAVAGIVYGAVLYTTAEDKADQVKKATDIITNVVIGLVLFALMYALLNYIVPGGVFA